MSAQPWTVDEVKRALAYGFCLVCMAPHEVRRTETRSEDGRVVHTHVELVKPCGHTQTDVDRKLAEMEVFE